MRGIKDLLSLSDVAKVTPTEKKKKGALLKKQCKSHVVSDHEGNPFNRNW